MKTVEMYEKMKLALALLEEIGDSLNDRGRSCECCGLMNRENFDDFQAKQAIEASANRISKLIEKLLEGAWKDRDFVNVVSADSLRGGKPR